MKYPGLSPAWVGAIAASSAIVIGVFFSTLPHGPLRQPVPSSPLVPSDKTAVAPVPEAIALWVAQSPQQRRAPLEALVKKGQPPERDRARYLLAQDALAQKDGPRAIALLQAIEDRTFPLAPYVLASLARAHHQNRETSQAEALWQTLLERYPQAPIAAEAMVALGSKQPERWQQALQQFPAYPATVHLVFQQLQHYPNDLDRHLLVARYGLHLPNFEPWLDGMVKRFAPRLSPEAWEVIAFSYWEKQAYGKGSQAYGKAPKTALNQYRAARGLQLDGQIDPARRRYHQLLRNFPQAPEAAMALSRLAQIAPNDTEALAYLDRWMAQFPHQTDQALPQKIKVLERRQDTAALAKAQTQLLQQYGTSEGAAELRWQRAIAAAQAQDWGTARRWAQEIVTHQGEGNGAAQALFWSGKWAERLGQPHQARRDWQKLLDHYPDSYYGWRGAQLLGLNVGTFTQVRSQQPVATYTPRRFPLPAGSPPLQELYQLGQDQDAWALWQVEFTQRTQPTIPLQFTDGVLRTQVGEYLDGLFMVGSLAWHPQRHQQQPDPFLQLQGHPAYWYALYPRPYDRAIARWSGPAKMNSLLVTALIRQESRFDAAIESTAGALGLMQVLPETAAWIAPQISLPTYDLKKPEDNLRLGIWYLDHTHRIYNDNTLLAIASYNAGPGNVEDWLQRLDHQDPDWWIEQIPFPETQNYVKAIFGNYWNYRRLYDPALSQALAQRSATHRRLLQVQPLALREPMGAQ